MILGAATESKLFGLLEGRRAADSLTITTDDGSAGIPGRVTDPLPAIMAERDTAVVYACGPMPMLASVAQVAAAAGAHSQCAVEEAMACGVGVCMTCVLPVIGDDGTTRMVRSCTDGPVFFGDRVRWADVGTVPPDTLGAPSRRPLMTVRAVPAVRDRRRHVHLVGRCGIPGAGIHGQWLCGRRARVGPVFRSAGHRRHRHQEHHGRAPVGAGDTTDGRDPVGHAQFDRSAGTRDRVVHRQRPRMVAPPGCAGRRVHRREHR